MMAYWMCVALQTTIRPEDVIVREARVDFSMETENPLDNVMFFNEQSEEPFSLAPHSVTYMYPGCFSVGWKSLTSICSSLFTC